jgi:hypothetical protein
MVRPPADIEGLVVDIFDEVEEDLRAERTRSLLKRYGAALAGLALAAILAVAAWQGWRWYQTRDTLAVAQTYLRAAEQAGTPGAASRFAQIAARGPAGYRTLARLREAALRADAGDTAAALALWDQVASDDSTLPPLRDLATLLWVEHQVDQGDPAILQARLASLTAPDNIWHPLALENLALIQLRTGSTAPARATLRRLASDVTAPEGVRSRAGNLLAGLGG